MNNSKSEKRDILRGRVKYAHTQSENLNADVASPDPPPLLTCAITAMGTSSRRNDFWNLLGGQALLYMIG